MLFIGTALAV